MTHIDTHQGWKSAEASSNMKTFLFSLYGTRSLFIKAVHLQYNNIHLFILVRERRDCSLMPLYLEILFTFQYFWPGLGLFLLLSTAVDGKIYDNPVKQFP